MDNIRYALLSVSDKTGIVDLSRVLISLGIKILSTGGTARLLREHQIEVIEVSDYTGFPEMMSGRVKTLHPKVHGGLLGRRGLDDEVMQQHDIYPISLLVVNLYPFVQTVARLDCTLAEAIENIDIGGPAMLRSAAKNCASVGVVIDSADYVSVADELQARQGTLSYSTCFMLAQKAFAYTADYDGNIANYLGGLNAEGDYEDFPLTYTCQFKRAQVLRYGENPHQRAGFYSEPDPPAGSLAGAQQRHGKALSYNNIADADVALNCVLDFADPACVIVKHANPCGVAVANTSQTAYANAYASDPTSAFGGVIAFNRALDGALLTAILAQQFIEVIIAPEITAEAIACAQDKPAVRLLEVGTRDALPPYMKMQRVSGGLLLQEADQAQCPRSELQVVSERAPTLTEWDDLLFAWQVVKYVKSNAIVYAKDCRTIGIGAGQMSRIYSARIATIKAADEKLNMTSAVMASDAFFPFRDSIDIAHESGIEAVIQPGGSVRDKELIEACNAHDMAMVFTHMRHFLH